MLLLGVKYSPLLGLSHPCLSATIAGTPWKWGFRVSLPVPALRGCVNLTLTISGKLAVKLREFWLLLPLPRLFPVIAGLC